MSDPLASLPRGALRYGGPALALAALAAQALAFSDLRFDDAFITYRYGQNLATGHGLTFNPGERFLGSTSPGHMLLAAAVYALTGHAATPYVMAALGCAGWTAQAVAAYFLLRDAVGRSLALAVAAALAAGAARSFQWVPLETNLVAALALWAFVAAQRRRFSAMAALLGLAALMRPDALLLGVPLFGYALLVLRARVVVPAAVFALIVLPWVAFATFYYGSPLPQSAVEKFQRTELAVYGPHLLRTLAGDLLPFVTPNSAALPAYALLGAAAAWLVVRRPFFALLLLYGALHAAAYLLLRPVAGHDWHLYPISLVAAVLALGGLALVAAGAGPHPLRLFASATLAGLIAASAARTVHEGPRYEQSHWAGARDAVYRRTAAFLRAHARPGDEFACVEVGTLAYYTDLRAYDLGGLVTDLRRTSMAARPVRFLVLDRKYMRHAPPSPPVFSAREGPFEAAVFYLPERGESR